jgi:pimeloyl-ACP methyl ester carboxylesterase
MATYALIHGAGDSAFYWHLVARGLRGHEAVAMDLPCDDDSAGLADYVDAVVEAIGERPRPILVAHSFGAFTAPLVCERLPVAQICLVAAMVPAPGEKGEDWLRNTRYPEPQPGEAPSDGEEGDIALFYHDVPPALAAEAVEHGRRQSETPGRDPWPLEAWPAVPTRFLLCTGDRIFPAQWLRGVVRERVGIVADEIESGHCPALSRPGELVDWLEAGSAGTRSRPL